MTTPDLDALAKLGPFTVAYYDQAYGDDSFVDSAGMGLSADDALPALNEWVELRKEVAELRATVELVAGNLLAAQEKRDDAPMSADAHIDEAITALKVYTGNVSYSDEAKDLRAKLWSTTGAMAAEVADLRAYRERTDSALRKLCQLVNNGDGQPMDLSGYQVVVAYIGNGAKRVRDMVREDMERNGLWRNPAPKEASDGN